MTLRKNREPLPLNTILPDSEREQFDQLPIDVTRSVNSAILQTTVTSGGDLHIKVRQAPIGTPKGDFVELAALHIPDELTAQCTAEAAHTYALYALDQTPGIDPELLARNIQTYAVRAVAPSAQPLSSPTASQV
ncbi:hypothetical protein COV82_04595 [Candidatus Peregrinibacteria bacterium CG11_big_fil_rev_8_21_14_0_20_46_8]|nr:MAG: hypothetical protein COV82_04595 [Candidatus Peregrinibacteria bacterium CG11_big_fil_rev_8_21_14_0_20_46_8]